MTAEHDSRVDEALRRLAADRYDNKAWRTLFDLLWPFAVAICARFHGGDTAAAKDSAQESLIRFARYAPFADLLSLTEVHAYLRTVCRRVVHTWSVERGPTAVPLEEVPLASGDLDPDENVDAQRLLQAILDQLDDDDRQLLEMTIKGFSIDEIAASLGISYGAAGVRIHRLRNRVRKWLQHL